ncbi:MAG: CBS domain-containing protein, partial [Dehalococcoidia bacterium]|nr:CBS domain-containing protein [Dehalococcoidia bacterium]
MKVRDVMSTAIVEIAADATCQDAAKLMRDHGVGILVVTHNGRVLEGVITDRDLVVRCLALGGDPSKQRVGEYTDRHPATVDGDLELERAVQMMRNSRLHRLPVVVGGSHVVGLLSLDDVAVDVKHYLDAFLGV